MNGQRRNARYVPTTAVTIGRISHRKLFHTNERGPFSPQVQPQATTADHAPELPQLHIGQESSPFAHPVIVVELVDLFDVQSSPASLAVGKFRITPGRPESKLVSDCEAHDHQDADHVLEKVVSRKSGATLYDRKRLAFSSLPLQEPLVQRLARQGTIERERVTYNWINTGGKTTPEQKERG